MAKIYKAKKENYTVLSNTVIRDERLSWKARGIFAYLYAQHNEWDFYETEVMNHATDGRDSLRKGLAELEKLGYLKRSRVRDEGGHVTGTDWIISDEPMLDGPMLENPTQVEPKTDLPMLEKPMLEKPTLENPTLINTNQINTNKTITKNKNNGQSKIARDRELREKFEALWKIYPKKKGSKDRAFTAYKKAVKDGVTDEKIRTAILAYTKELNGDLTYARHGQTWFVGKGWEDDYSAPKSPVGGNNDGRASAYGDWSF